MTYFDPDRAEKIIRTHDDETLRITFTKRTNGRDRAMRCRVSKYVPDHNMVEVVELLGDPAPMYAPPGYGEATTVRNVPFESIKRIEAKRIAYEPIV